MTDVVGRTEYIFHTNVFSIIVQERITFLVRNRGMAILKGVEISIIHHIRTLGIFRAIDDTGDTVHIGLRNKVLTVGR